MWPSWDDNMTNGLCRKGTPFFFTMEHNHLFVFQNFISMMDGKCLYPPSQLTNLKFLKGRARSSYTSNLHRAPRNPLHDASGSSCHMNFCSIHLWQTDLKMNLHSWGNGNRNSPYDWRLIYARRNFSAISKTSRTRIALVQRVMVVPSDRSLSDCSNTTAFSPTLFPTIRIWSKLYTRLMCWH